LTAAGSEILLVRAAEETDAVSIPAEALVDAHAAAGTIDDDTAWLARRSRALLAGPLADLRPLAAMTQALHGGLAVLLGGSAMIGLASNYLGPSAKIHVLFNPIALLILWNLLAYLALGSIAIARLVRGPAEPSAGPGAVRAPTAPPTPNTSGTGARPPGRLTRLVVGRLVPAVWFRVHRAVLESQVKAGDLAKVSRRFWALWMEHAGRSLVPLVRRALHVAAIGLAIGAVAGMYARGLFFEYNVIWRSTFITDADAFVRLIQLALGPAALALGQGLPADGDAALLLTDKGAPAASWIHLYGISALLFIVMPRTMMAAAATWRARRLRRHARLDLGEPYFRDLLAKARRLQVAELEDAIEADVRAACNAFGDGMATFVCARLYDESLAPRIREFRTEGGSVAALEANLAADCERFQPLLGAHVPEAQAALEADLVERVGIRVGTTLSLETIRRHNVAGRVEDASDAASGDLGGSLGHGLANTVSTAVGAAIAVVAGTVGGGFGETMGIALLVGALESGPVGWVAGAVAGLLAAGAGWWLGRDRLAEGMKQISLPAFVVRTVLWEARMERLIADGRSRCAQSVRDFVAHELDEITPELADEIWRRLKPVLGERQRPRSIDD